MYSEIVFKAMTCSTVCMSSRLDIKPNHLQVKYFNIQSCLHCIVVEFKILYQLVSAHTLYIILKCPCDQKNHFLFFFSLWKCVCLTLDRQNFEIWFLSKGRLLWVYVLDFTIRHYSRSKLTDGTSEGWIQGKVTIKGSPA